jgi:hypothetical protein
MPRTPRAARLAAALVLFAGGQSGCVNVMVMAGKVFFGDSHVMSAFEQRTGVSLCDGEQQVVLVCTAPGSASEGFESFATELQDEVHLLLKMHGVNVLKSPEPDAMSAAPGPDRDWEAVAHAHPGANYILHVDVERFSGIEDASPGLLRGRASGMLYAYEVHRSSTNAGRPRVLKVYFQEFHSEYPTSHPVPADQVSIRVFGRRFVEHLAQQVGRTFYDVPTADALR